MDDETPGVTQGALPQREGPSGPRPVVERPAVRLTQVAGGQYVLTTSQPHGVPALAQLTPLPSQGVTRIISINPSRVNQQTNIRPSLANQSIVSVLTKPRTNTNVRLQLFSGNSSPANLGETSSNSNSVQPMQRQQSVQQQQPAIQQQQPVIQQQQQQPQAIQQQNQQAVQQQQPVQEQKQQPVQQQQQQQQQPLQQQQRSPVKRSFTLTEKKDTTYAAKLQQVLNHKLVRSKLTKEKYNELIMESYYLDIGGNILDLPQFIKKSKPQACLNYLKEHSIDNRDVKVLADTPVLTPIATSVSSLPGSSHNSNHHVNSIPTVNIVPVSLPTEGSRTISTPLVKVKTPFNHQPSTPTLNQEQMVEKAKQEAYVVQRVSDLQKEGLWSERRLPKLQEMPRPKAHWDFVLEEMVWLAADFAQERKWKKAAAKKCSRMITKYFQDKVNAAQKAEKMQEQNIRKVANICAKEIRNFWAGVERLVEFKHSKLLEVERKRALDQHLSFIVDQTEKYSQLLTEGMNQGLSTTEAPPPPTSSAIPSSTSSKSQSDVEFDPDNQTTTDDEETIEQAEAAGGGEDQKEEVAALQRESQMELDDVLKNLPKDYLKNRDSIGKCESDKSDNEPSDDDEVEEGDETKEEDEEFKMDVDSAEDDEATIEEQEKEEGEVNHEEEIKNLMDECNMSIEELRCKYNVLTDDVGKVIDGEKQEDDAESSSENEDEEMDVSDDDEEGEDEEMDISDGRDSPKDLGLKSLLKDSCEGEKTKTDKNNDFIEDAAAFAEDAAAFAESIQPKGNTLSSTNVKTKIPFLLRYQLREYQHIGLDWLVTMNDRKLNGILADEMGLGKTIQTIALLAHLACERGNWGPHLIIVPTSVMLNWEIECKKWCPSFKILTYFGSQKERKLKRTGWTKPNAFHICITSYKLVIQDHQSFRRKKWNYLILDEAQNIKNFKSQRWQMLLNFQTEQRLLLTGTPLQNNLMELWSLMHFLMPNVFQSHKEFKEWFANPVTGMIEGNAEYNESIIKRLHKVLRPFLLRRLKAEVEKQMPKKFEHVIMCRLSKRQRFLYDDFMNRAKTIETLAKGNLLSVINVLMQLRKVCNHPNLFEVRPIVSPFQFEGITLHIPSLIYAALRYNVWKDVSLDFLNLNLLGAERTMSAYQCFRTIMLQTPRSWIQTLSVPSEGPFVPPCKLQMRIRQCSRKLIVEPAPQKPPVQEQQPQISLQQQITQQRQQLQLQLQQQRQVLLKQHERQVQLQQERHLQPQQVHLVRSQQRTEGGHLIRQFQPNLKVKVNPQYGVQLVNQQGIVKAIPVNLTQSNSSGTTGQVLKSSDKISASFAQLVQTSTGKHLLLTSNPTSAPVSTATGGTQKLTFLSKQPVLAASNTSSQVTRTISDNVPSSVSGKGIVKIQIPVVTLSSSGVTSTTPVLIRRDDSSGVTATANIGSGQVSRVISTSGPITRLIGATGTSTLPKTTSTSGSVVASTLPKTAILSTGTVGTAGTTSTTTTTTTSTTTAITDSKAKVVGPKFIDQLYVNQPSTSNASLDVRWGAEKEDYVEGENVNEELDVNDVEGLERGDLKRRLRLMARVNAFRCRSRPLYGEDFREVCTIREPTKNRIWCNGPVHCNNTFYNDDIENESTMCLSDLLHTPCERIEDLKGIFDRFMLYVPAVLAPQPQLKVSHPPVDVYWEEQRNKATLIRELSEPTAPLHAIATAMVLQFPDPRLIQYDCGKLQTLDVLLRTLKLEKHRVLIFTQMTKMLDVLEAFLNYHGHIYLRLDGTTRIENRQMLMEKFNHDDRYFVFILSTRSGGIGVNLIGADTVIFYDSDWNPTMDAQAQDRCHRIGQTRDVHIYRLISERTIEVNILKKANQKRLLGNVAIEGGNFTTAYFRRSAIKDLFHLDANEQCVPAASEPSPTVRVVDPVEESVATGDEKDGAIGALENALAECEDDQDVQATRTAKAEAVADLAEFDEDIPLEEKEPEKEYLKCKAEQELESVMKHVSAIERYGMRFFEEMEAVAAAEQVAAAQREMEEQKLNWEKNQMAVLKEEQERRARELEEENDLITYCREDAVNQFWGPPTPPTQDNDLYIDQSLAFLYGTVIMSESQLPPVYVKKDLKRTRHEAGFNDGRRNVKTARRDDRSMNAPRSLFHSAALMKMKRDMKLQKYRSGGGVIRPNVQIPGKPNVTKSSEQTLWHEWTIHEDMAILKVIQTFQSLPLNLIVQSPGHTPNWDFVADYVNSVSVTYRSPKQCRQRYESVLIQREEGKQIYDNSLRKKKNKSGTLLKFSFQQKSTRPMRTSQMYTQDNNSTFSKIMIQRYDTLKNISSKRVSTQRTITNNPMLKNKHTAMLNECGIDVDRPVLPIEVIARRAERLAREKNKLTPEQQQMAAARLHLMKGVLGAVGAVQGQKATTPPPPPPATALAASSSNNTTGTSLPQTVNIVAASASVATVSTPATTTPPAPNALRSQRLLTSPLQTSAVVSVSGLSPVQGAAATQRLIVSTNSPGQAKTVVGIPTGLQGKTISPAQLQLIRQQQTFKQHLRLQAGTLQAGQNVKTSTVVTIAGQQAVVQFTQAPARQQPFVRQGTLTVGGKTTTATRTVSDNEVTQLLKKQQLQQQQKTLVTANVNAISGSAGVSSITNAVSNANVASSSGTVQTTQNVQNLQSQVFAQAMQQAAGSGGQVATLVKAVSSAGGITQTVTIPVSSVTIGNAKTITPTLKATNQQQIRQLQIQQHQLIAQKKLSAQKLNLTQVTGKGGNVQAQLIVGPKPLSTAMTVQQFTQVMRAPLGVSQGPVVLTKGTPRVIPVNTSQGTKQTIQVVATSQALSSALRPQGSSTLAGALAGIKVQGQTNSQAQQALLSQVSAALQNQTVAVRQSGSPVRLQTASGASIVAVTVQPTSNASVQQNQQHQQQQQQQNINADQVSRFLKK